MQKEKNSKVGFAITFAVIGFGLFGAPLIGKPVNLKACADGEVFDKGICWVYYEMPATETVYDYNYTPTDEQSKDDVK